MIKKMIAMMASGMFMLCAVGVANAAIYTGTSTITETAQSFQFNVSPAEIATGSGVFTIEANGDYSLGWPDFESVLTWNIDGIVSGEKWCATNADESISYSYDDVYWKKSILIDYATMLNITSDKNFQISIYNASDVNPFNEKNPDWISYTLDYKTTPTPIPAAIWIFASGLAGIAGLVRKKNRT